MSEQRKHDRFDLTLEIEVDSLQGGSRKLETTSLEDISIGGAKFTIKGELQVGSILDMSLVDRNSQFAKALGLVTDSTGPLNFQMNCRVVRILKSDEDEDSNLVAVEFSSPLRITQIAE